MLILSRKVGEIIRIGPKIQIMVLDARKGQITLGFEAPPIIPIIRNELHEKKRTKNSNIA